MASNASSDALGFPVRGMPKTVREKNIIFNVIKYSEDEKQRHGKQKFRPNAVMQKAAEATGVPLRTLQRLSNANSESKKIKCKKAKLSREKFGKLDDFDLGVIRRLIHQFYFRNESPTLRGGGRSARLVRPFEKNLDHTIIGPTKILQI